MLDVWLYSLVSVVIVSVISLVGIIALGIRARKLRTFLVYLISFAAGALLGDAFIHLIPEVVEKGFSLAVSFYILGGISVFFVLEKVIHWQHCHENILSQGHVHSFAYMNLVGDALHNFIDGIIIASSYLISLPSGIATTIAVGLHEIPQEIGDFGILLHGGFSKGKALALNFVSALFAVLGAVITLWVGGIVSQIETMLIPFAVGGFIYIAGSDLIPQLHKHGGKISQSILQLIAFVLGILVMAALVLLE